MIHTALVTTAVILTALTVAGGSGAVAEHREGERASARVLWWLTGGCALLAAATVAGALVTA